MGRAVEPLEAAAKVAQAEAAVVERRERGLLHATAVVVDREEQVATFDPCLDAQRAGAELRRQAVLHRVLDQRLEAQVRNRMSQRLRIDRGLDPEPVAEAGALDLEIGLHDLELLAERHELLILEPKELEEFIYQAVHDR